MLSYLHPDRLFPSDDKQRDIARAIYQKNQKFTYRQHHGHTDPSWFFDNQNFSNATE